MAIGSTVKEENGIPISVGDKVLINVDNPKIGKLVLFNKETGEFAKYGENEDNCDMYILLEAREILMVL
jgi:hypothetical protein